MARVAAMNKNIRRDTDLGVELHTQPLKGGAGRLQLSEAVAMHLREQIISGKLSPGEFLRIDAIATELGVSSTPVREGLLLLQSESIVRLIPRRGFVVVGLRADDLLDLFWAQATIAAELAARAAVAMTADDIAALQELDEQHQHAVAKGETALATQLGHLFHRKINLSAQSPRLAQLLGNLTRQLPNRFYASIEGQLKGAVDYHPIIVNAIRMQDADSARSLMFRHIVSGGKHLVATLEHTELSLRDEKGNDKAP